MSGSEYRIRTARSTDLPAVLAAYDWLFAAPGSRPPRWDAHVAERRLSEAIGSDRATVLVAESDGAIVGFCTLYRDIESVRFGVRVWMEDLAVDPTRRSRGIGKHLLTAAKVWARARGAERLALDSGEGRVDAHRFYEREGPSYRSQSYGWWLA